jgi:gliding motility-associated-like protein
MPQNDITYQWYKAGASTGVTGYDFRIDDLESDDVTRYAVMATNAQGCHALSLEYIITDASRKFFVPNVFTPNGDGLNDVFEIVGLEQYVETKLEIVNKQGILIYSAANYNNDWDGGVYPSDIYFYSLKVKQKDGKSQTHTGYFYIKRDNW